MSRLSDKVAMASLSDFLKTHRLEKYAQALQDLGVECLDDLNFVDPGDLEQLGKTNEKTSLFRTSRPRTHATRKGADHSLLMCPAAEWRRIQMHTAATS